MAQLTITKDETFWFVIESCINCALLNDIIAQDCVDVVLKVRDEISTAIDEHERNSSKA